MLKKSLAMVAIAGMLASPLALAQDAGGGVAGAAGGGAPATGGLAGLATATGLSTTVLVGIGTVVAIGAVVAATDGGDGGGPSGTQ